MDASLLSSNASTVWVVAVSSEAAAGGITGSVVRKVGSGSCCCKSHRAFVHEAAEETVGADFVYDHTAHRANAFSRRYDLHRLQVRRTAYKLPGQFARLFEQHFDGASGKASIETALMTRDSGLQPVQALRLHFSRDLLFYFGRRSAGSRRIHKGKCASVTDLVDQCEGVTEIRFGLTRETDDKIGREGEIRAACTKTCNHAEVVLARVLAVHR